MDIAALPFNSLDKLRNHANDARFQLFRVTFIFFQKIEQKGPAFLGASTQKGKRHN